VPLIYGEDPDKIGAPALYERITKERNHIMLTGKQKNDFKIILILLALSTALLAVPILAKQQRSNSRKPSNSSKSAKGQPVQSRVEGQVKNAAKAPTRIAPTARSSKPQIISGISRNKYLSSLGRVTKSNTNQPGMIVSSRQTNRATLRRRAILQLQSSISVRAPSNIKTQRGVSSSIAKRNSILNRIKGTANPDNNRNSDRTSRISSQITTNPSTSLRAGRPSISTPSTQPRAGILKSPATTSTDSRISSSKASRTRLGEAPSRSRIGSPIQRWTRQKSSTSIISSRSFDPARGRSEQGRRDRLNRGQSSGSSSSELRITESQTRGRNRSGIFETLRTIGKKPAENRADTGRTRKSINLRVVDSLRLSSRPRKSTLEIRANTLNANPSASLSPRDSLRRTGVVNNANPTVVGHGGLSKVYREYPPVIRNKHRYEHIYWDYHNQLRHRIIWPRYRFTVCYTYGPHFTFRYVYPYYLRRYIFVSLGGYWPLEYRYTRYYWYGCHPYRWYGYYPIAHEVTGDTYNYYTHNYYYGDNGTVPSVSAQGVDGIKPVDHNTFADVREKLAKEPDMETPADIKFDEAVKAFEIGDYETAIENLTEASELAPDDTVLPFAYSQALFANEQYAEAADVLRVALTQVSPEKEGVFYPRGLYPDDEVLFEQIKHLSEKAELYSFDADLQLLMGYHLLGTGEIDKATEPLLNASQDLENVEAATILLNLLTKISPASGGQETDTKTENAVQ